MQARKDMDPKFQWDFTHLYASDEAWEEALNALRSELSANVNKVGEYWLVTIPEGVFWED